MHIYLWARNYVNQSTSPSCGSPTIAWSLHCWGPVYALERESVIIHTVDGLVVSVSTSVERGGAMEDAQQRGVNLISGFPGARQWTLPCRYVCVLHVCVYICAYARGSRGGRTVVVWCADENTLTVTWTSFRRPLQPSHGTPVAAGNACTAAHEVSTIQSPFL